MDRLRTALIRARETVDLHRDLTFGDRHPVLSAVVGALDLVVNAGKTGRRRGEDEIVVSGHRPRLVPVLAICRAQERVPAAAWACGPAMCRVQKKQSPDLPVVRFWIAELNLPR